MQSRSVPQTSMIIATFIWGISNVFVEFALDFLDPLSILLFRFGTATLVLNLYLICLRSKKYYQLMFNKTCVLLGWIGALGYYLGTTGQDMMSVGLATLLSTSYIVIIPVILLVSDRRKLSGKELFSISIALIGIILIAFNGKIENILSFSVFGIILLLLQALEIGIYVIASEKFLKSAIREKREVNLLTYLNSIVTHVFTGLIILSMFVPIKTGVINVEMVLIILFLAIFPTLIAYSLYNWAVIRLGSVKTSFYLLLQVVIPMLYDLFMNSAIFSLYYLTGVLLVLSSILILETINTQMIQKFILKLRTTRLISISRGSPVVATVSCQEKR